MGKWTALSLLSLIFTSNVEALVLEIDRIEIKGVNLFSEEVIEKSLQISPGDAVERTKILATEDSLLSLYQVHGYKDVSIQSRLIRQSVEDKALILEISVREGNPVRIASLDIDFLNAFPKDQSPWFESLREELERKIRTKIHIKVGDVLDQEKISEGKRAIQDLLAAKEYVGTRIEDDFSEKGVPLDSHQGSSAAYWVKLRLKVDIGEKVNFGFRGNTVFTRGYLDAVIDEMRLLGLGRDYVSAIKFRIEDEYKNAGFARVNVNTFTSEGRSNLLSSEVKNRREHEKKVTYEITEGPRVKIQTVDFDGNLTFDSEFLRKQFFLKASGPIQNKIFVAKEVQRTAELLVESLKEKGYLSAKLITVNAFDLPSSRFEKKDGWVRLLIYVYEGDQTIVENLKISGNTVFSLDEIKAFISVRERNPLNLFSFEEGLESMKKAYLDRGYLNFSIENEHTEGMIQYSHENRVADVSLNLIEGPLYYVSEIVIEGLQKTQEYIVNREIVLKRGEVLRDSDIIQTKLNLERLHVFQNITIRSTDDPVKTNHKIVKITVHEADRGILTWGPGIRNDLGVRLFGQLSYTNLWGKNHTAALNLSVNRRFLNYHFAEGQAQFTYAWPWFAIPYLTFRPSLFIGQTQFINFAASNVIASTVWDLPVMKAPLLTASLGYSLEKINQFNAPLDEDNQNLRIGTITPKLSVDLRDSALSPSRGALFSSWFDFAYPSLGSQDMLGYYRVQFRADYYISLVKDLIGYISIRTGYERSLIRSPDLKVDSIPLIKQFALGGIGSVRGYQQQEINYQGRFDGRTLSYVNYRFQIDFPFAGSLKLGAFLDAANLLVDQYSLGGLFYGTGFGFHYQTPVGPINFDWGFKVNPPPGAEPYVIHFSVGVM